MVASNFLDLLSSFGFRPLILQPTRVTASSASLIDNIFVNTIETESLGGNITTSVSDHFSQFSVLDILKKANRARVPIKQRSFRNFSYAEVEEELGKLDWQTLLANKNCEDAFSFFYRAIEKLLDEMAPYKTLNKKEQNLLQRPWISIEILEKMHIRDDAHKSFLKEKNSLVRANLFDIFKKKRNEVLTLIRKSKTTYFHTFFESNKLDI